MKLNLQVPEHPTTPKGPARCTRPGTPRTGNSEPLGWRLMRICAEASQQCRRAIVLRPRNISGCDAILTQYAGRMARGESEGAMTPRQINLVQESLPAILALRDRATARSREHPTVLDRAPGRLFAGADMGRQGAVLINAVATAVQALRSGDYESAAAALSQYHLCYGVGTRHFRSAGAALVRALEQELGSGFSAELGHAWTAACEWVGRVILEASHPMAA
jgi:hemoglobin-like flavoprotein